MPTLFKFTIIYIPENEVDEISRSGLVAGNDYIEATEALFQTFLIKATSNISHLTLENTYTSAILINSNVTPVAPSDEQQPSE